MILGLAAALGLAFNATNPIGIRWSDAALKETRFDSPAPTPAVAVAPASQARPISDEALVSGTNPPPVASVPSLTAQYVPPTPTTWAEVKAQHAQRQVVLVDCRSRAAFEAAHIPGAVLLSEPPSAEDFAAFRRQYPTNAHVVVYCSSTSCSLSFKLAHRLAREGGYSFVQFMTGGFFDWQREETLARSGQSTTSTLATVMVKSPGPREVPPQEKAPVTPPIAPLPTGEKLEHALPILWAQAKPLLSLGQAMLLDARSKAEFDAGHVPGALWLPADASPETIRQLLGNHARTTRLVTYCGAMGCPEAFQLATRLVREFDFPNAQFMLEGYVEWRKVEQTPTQQGPAR